MKHKSLRLLMAMLLIAIATAAKAEVVSVTLTREGTLAEKVLEQASSLSSVTELTVTGRINERDWECMVVQMTHLEVLDMSKATASFKEISGFNRNVKECRLPKGLTSIGNTAFSRCSSLQQITLPEGLTSIGDNAFYGCSSLQQISLPEGLTSISDHAFDNCSSLQQISLPEGLTSIGNYAFEYCRSLQQISLPEGLTSIGKRAFHGCSSLQQISLPEGLTSISDDTFYDCSSLQQISLPEGLTSIGNQAFYDCSSLQQISLPEGLTSIGNKAFYDCRSLQQIYLPEGLTSIGYSAFQSCGSLQEVTFPESLIFLGNGTFSGCSGLTKVTCLIPFPISASGNIFPGIDIEKCTLVVPEWSALLYKMAVGWSEFANIQTIKTDDLSNITVTDTRYLPETVRPNGTPNVKIKEAGSLIVRGESPLTMDDVTLEMSVKEGKWNYGYDSDGKYIQWYTPNQSGGVLLNDGSNLSAQSAKIRIQSVGGIWGFISLPFDVKISDITNDPGKKQSNFVFKYYDGERRGLVGSGGNWTEATNILKAGTGYIYQSQDSASIILPATPETVANICTKADVKTVLNEYPSEDAEDAGWNFIGNPYPTYFNTHYIDFTAPITVWNGQGYDAISLTDDEFVLSPYQAFFAQKQADGNTVTFFAEGRLAENSTTKQTNRIRAKVPSRTVNDRTIYNIYLSNGGYTDKCRIVVNERSNAGYDASSDAVKFFSDNASLPQIYSIGDKGIEYAINERPTGTGIIELGVHATNGTYKISSDSDNQIYLIDRKENKTIDLSATSYEFAADSSDSNGRFAISIDGNMSSVIESVEPSAVDLSVIGNTLTIKCSETETINIYSLDGISIGSYTGHSDYTVELPQGIYFVKTSHSVEKIIVK